MTQIPEEPTKKYQTRQERLREDMNRHWGEEKVIKFIKKEVTQVDTWKLNRHASQKTINAPKHGLFKAGFQIWDNFDL